ncbi:hypothetical protein MINT15_21500 [Saccharomonospora viridis]|uniref:Uncharacterized protein n=1 Tax=Saccharomonospora viridis TaxID=1852 RepID=A0A837D9F7_9PSEU|nr:hypothetical protein MINT15_21500 [Saccharomonospora viridis]
MVTTRRGKRNTIELLSRRQSFVKFGDAPDSRRITLTM